MLIEDHAALAIDPEQGRSVITAPPVDPSTFDASLARVSAELFSLESERADALFAISNAPNDEELHALAAQVEGEVVGARAKLARLESARVEAKARFTADARAAFHRQLQADAAQLRIQGEELFKLTTEAYKAIVRLGPQLKRIADTAALRRDLAWGVMRASTSDCHELEAAGSLAAGDGGSIPMLLEAAFRAAGVGAGATKGITVAPPPVYWARNDSRAWHSSSADHVSLARAEFDKQEATLSTRLESSIEKTVARDAQKTLGDAK